MHGESRVSPHAIMLRMVLTMVLTPDEFSGMIPQPLLVYAESFIIIIFFWPTSKKPEGDETL